MLRGNLSQYGSNQIGKMGKKNKKDKILDQDGILNECATSLDTAFIYAVEHRDVDSMLAVSDRWLRLYAMLSQLEDEKEETLKLGFINDNNQS
jgi:hypothetical protein